MTRYLALILPLILTACGQPFDRPGLFLAAPEEAREAIGDADRHILVVRHARKVAEDCNALDCALSDRGYEMVDALEALLEATPVDSAMSSAACRTVHTARAGGTEVTQHQPAPGIGEGCEIEAPVTRTRALAMLEASESDDRWTLVAEHSNTVCLWVAAYVETEGTLCEDGSLSSDRYGDIFWLYRVDGNWQLVTLERVFDVSDSG